MNFRTWIASLVSLAVVGLAPTAFSAPPVGWRTDGTGTYPNAEPVTEWAKDKNVVWFTPLKKWSNATPVIVGDRLFVCAEPDTLVCLNVDDGEVLWERANPVAGMLDEKQKAEADRQAEIRAEIEAEITPVKKEFQPLDKQWRQLQADLHKTPDDPEIKKQYDVATAQMRQKRGEHRKVQGELRRLRGAPKDGEAGKRWEQVNARSAALKKELDDLKKQVEKLKVDVKSSPEAAEIRTKLAALRPDIDRLKKQIGAHQGKIKTNRKYLPPATHGTNGYSSPTPTSDGEYVFAVFGTGAVVCYDLDGNRKWAKYVESPTHGWGHSASPLQVGKTLLVHILQMVALDKSSGAELWRTPSAPAWGSPVAATVGETEVAITPSGDIIRVSDGVKLAGKVSKLDYAAPLVDKGVVYFVESGGKALQLPAEAGDKISPKVLWTTTPKKDRYYASPVIHDGLIYAITQKSEFSIIDAANGEVVKATNLKLGGTAYPSIAMVGKHLFVSSDNGKTAVFSLGRECKQVASNRLEKFRSSPVFQGGRMYVRTLKGVYCIGRK